MTRTRPTWDRTQDAVLDYVLLESLLPMAELSQDPAKWPMIPADELHTGRALPA